MKSEELADALELLADGPPWDTAWLRSLLPELAVRGRLVAQEEGGAAIEGKEERAAGGTLPLGWRWQSIGGISSIRTGKTPSKSKPEYWGGEIPWVSPKDMKSLTIHATEDTVTPAAVSDGLSLAPAGTVLLVVRSGILRHTVPVAVAGVECTTNQDIKQVRLDNPEQSRFLQLLIRGRQPEILSRFVKTGTTVQSLKSKEFFDAPFPFPPLAEQHRIVAKVDELMEHAAVVEERHLAATSARVRLRDAALHALAEAEDHEAVKKAWSRIEDHFDDLFTEPEDIQPLRQTILQLAVRGRLVAQEAGDEDVEVGEEHQLNPGGPASKRKAADVERYEAPVGWQWTQLGAVCSEVTVGHVGPMASRYKSDGIPFARSLNVHPFRFDPDQLKFINEEFHAELSKSGLKGGEILAVRSGDVGRACIVPRSITPANCSDLVIIRVGPNLLNRFGEIMLNSPFGKRQILGEKVGIAQGHFNIGSAKRFQFPLPPLAEQHRIVAKVDELMALCDTLETSLERAKATREQFATSISHALTTQA